MSREKWVYIALTGLFVAALLGVAFPGPLQRSETIAGIGRDISSFRTAAFAQRSRSIINDYVRTQSVRRLQIGAGSNRPHEWLNTDIEEDEGLAYLDATKRFPLDDNSFHYVFSEHVIEHLTYDEGMHMLAESFRILAPGGKVRITTPNLLRFVELFRQDQPEEMRRYIAGKLAWYGWPSHPTAECTILNLELSSFGHRFVYDPETLQAGLMRAGFESIREFKPGESDDPYLQGIETRQNWSIAELNAYEAMALEAVKPPKATAAVEQ